MTHVALAMVCIILPNRRDFFLGVALNKDFALPKICLPDPSGGFYLME